MNLWVEKGVWDPSWFQNIGTLKTYSKGDCIFFQHQPLTDIYLVISGRIRSYLLSPAGGERHLYVVGPKSLIGECNVWLKDTYDYSAAASTDVEAIKIPKTTFQDIVRSTPGFFEKTLQSMSQKQNALLIQTHLMSFSNIEERVTFILAQLAEAYGQPTGDTVKITIPFTHHELSQVVGASRVSVSNVMNALQDKGIISKANKNYIIHSLAHLQPVTL
jgi:CRP/FNR family transcriptional regulator, cyclic AMP receptor protein